MKLLKGQGYHWTLSSSTPLFFFLKSLSLLVSFFLNADQVQTMSCSHGLCHHTGLTHALFSPRFNICGEESSLTQLGKTIICGWQWEHIVWTCHWWPFSCVSWKENHYYLEDLDTYEMFPFPVHRHHLFLPNHIYLASSRLSSLPPPYLSKNLGQDIVNRRIVPGLVS